MKASVFETTQDFSTPLEKLFPFFADAANLGAITPPWLGFEILTPQPILMQVGTLIDYRIRWHGIPMRWRTRIAVWEPPWRFVDEQVKGPYRLWRHEHLFSRHGDTTKMLDRVAFKAPGGRLIEKLVVGPDVERIFDYRRSALESILESQLDH